MTVGLSLRQPDHHQVVMHPPHGTNSGVAASAATKATLPGPDYGVDDDQDSILSDSEVHAHQSQFRDQPPEHTLSAVPGPPSGSFEPQYSSHEMMTSPVSPARSLTAKRDPVSSTQRLHGVADWLDKENVTNMNSARSIAPGLLSTSIASSLLQQLGPRELTSPPHSPARVLDAHDHLSLAAALVPSHGPGLAAEPHSPATAPAYLSFAPDIAPVAEPAGAVFVSAAADNRDASSRWRNLKIQTSPVHATALGPAAPAGLHINAKRPAGAVPTVFTAATDTATANLSTHPAAVVPHNSTRSTPAFTEASLPVQVAPPTRSSSLLQIGTLPVRLLPSDATSAGRASLDQARVEPALGSSTETFEPTAGASSVRSGVKAHSRSTSFFRDPLSTKQRLGLVSTLDDPLGDLPPPLVARSRRAGPHAGLMLPDTEMRRAHSDNILDQHGDDHSSSMVCTVGGAKGRFDFAVQCADAVPHAGRRCWQLGSLCHSSAHFRSRSKSSECSHWAAGTAASACSN